MRIKKAAAALVLAALLTLAGCAPLSNLFGIGGGETQEELLTNGTTTGNILNGGFAVKDGDDLLFYYTGGDVYPAGSLVRSNPETTDSSLVMEKSGLYMNLVDGMLYYCTDDGVYRTSLENPAPVCVLEGDCSLLQIVDGRMYFIRDGVIGSAALDGAAVEFTPAQNAACLNVYGGKLYYISTDDGYIRQADMDGANQSLLYDKAVDMFYIIDDVIYFIDSADGYIKRMSLELESLETVVEAACSGFNVNRQGMYYTRTDDGLCYNAGPDGLQEKAIDQFGTSKWHVACMFGDGAIVIRQEDIS